MAGFKVHSIFAVHWAMAKALHLSINQNETYPQVLVLLIHLWVWKLVWQIDSLLYWNIMNGLTYPFMAQVPLKNRKMLVYLWEFKIIYLRLQFLGNTAFPFLFIQCKQNSLSKHNRDLLTCIWVKHLKSKKENNKIMYTFILFPLDAKYGMGLF